jgi:four helix bundle protein
MPVKRIAQVAGYCQKACMNSTATHDVIRFRFQKLEVWQEARRKNCEMYRLSAGFPSSEQYSLTSQVRRASVSIAANFAEGSGRNSDRDFARFLEQSYGSAMELASHLFLAFDLGYLGAPALDAALSQIDVTAKRIVALNRSLGISESKVHL